MIILKNATFIDYQTFEFKHTNILVHQGINAGIEFLDIIPEKANNKIIDCTGKYVTKSFACGHHHIYSALARGMGAPKKNPVNFYEILQYVWWTLDKCLDKDMIEASALATAVACAKNGVTFVIDHHASPNCIKGSLDIIAKAIEKVGLSHLLCYEITDRDGVERTELGLQETDDYLANYQGLVGLHASFTVGKNTLDSAMKIARKRNTGIHIHVAEDLFDQHYTEREYKKRVVKRLHEVGALELPKTILGHCLHLNDDERATIKLSNAWVVQNTESNLNNKVGFFNSQWLGNRIMLGTDGMHSDMLRSAKNSFFVGANFDEITYPGIYNRFRNVHNYLKENNFKGDGDNNLVVLDYNSPTVFNQDNFLGHFVFGLESSQVQHVIANGNLIVDDRKLTTVDENEVLKFSQKQSEILWKKMKTI